MDEIESQGELVRQRRVALGLTQKELADRAGLTDQAVSNIERAVIQRPHRATARALAQVLGLDADDLIGPVPAELSARRRAAALAGVQRRQESTITA